MSNILVLQARGLGQQPVAEGARADLGLAPMTDAERMDATSQSGDFKRGRGASGRLSISPERGGLI